MRQAQVHELNDRKRWQRCPGEQPPQACPPVQPGPPGRRDTSLAGSCSNGCWWLLLVTLTLLSCACWPALPHPICTDCHTPSRVWPGPQKRWEKRGQGRRFSCCRTRFLRKPATVTLLALLGRGHETDNVRARM